MLIFPHSRIINSDRNGATVGPDLLLDMYGNADDCFMSIHFFNHNLEANEETLTIHLLFD